MSPAKWLNECRCHLGCRVGLVQDNHCIVNRCAYPLEEWKLLGDIISKISGMKHVSVGSVCDRHTGVDNLLKKEKKHTDWKILYSQFVTHSSTIKELWQKVNKQRGRPIYRKKVLRCATYTYNSDPSTKSMRWFFNILPHIQTRRHLERVNVAHR